MSSDYAGFRAVQSQNSAFETVQARARDAFSADEQRVAYSSRDTRGVVDVAGCMFVLYCALAIFTVGYAASRRPRAPLREIALLVGAIVLYPVLVGPVQRALFGATAWTLKILRYSVFA